MTSPVTSGDRPLVATLLDRFETGGRHALVGEERSAAAELLTRLMTDRTEYDRFVSDLESEIARRPQDVQARLRNYGAPDIPEMRIISEGFAGLPDEVLADLVTSPAALEAVRFSLYDDPNAGPPGAWFFAPDTFRHRRLSQPIPSAVPSPAAPPAKPRRLNPWALAVAASVLLALGLGLGWLVRGPDDALHAKVGPMQKGPPRGSDPPPLAIPVENTGDRPLFVCLVGLSPDVRPRFFYAPESEYLRLPPGSGAVEHFSTGLAGSTAYLLVLSETPAGDVVEKLVPSTARAADALAARDRLAAQLRDHGYRAARVDVVTPP